MLDEKQTDWLLRFIIDDMTFTQKIKLFGRVKKMQNLFANFANRDCFPGVGALVELNKRYNPEALLDYEPRALLGRLANGAERDHGMIVHAVGKAGALCGAKPGGRSAGWSLYPEDRITCSKCLTNIEKLKNLTAMRREKC